MEKIKIKSCPRRIMRKLKAKPKPCPKCGCPRLVKFHILSALLPWWYYIECDNCHWRGKPKLFSRRAIKEWNKNKISNVCNQ